MHKPAMLTLVISVGGDRESDEPVAAYADSAQAQQAADEFNRQNDIRMWECGWQYTEEIPLINAEGSHDQPRREGNRLD